MSINISNNPRLTAELVALGIIPPLTTSFNLSIDINGPTILRTETFVSDEQLDVLMGVLVRNADELKAAARKITFKQQVGDRSIEVSL